MSNSFIRVQIDLTNVEEARDKYVWLPVFTNAMSTINDFKNTLCKQFNLNTERRVNLYIQGCLLREEDTILLLRDNDIVKIVYKTESAGQTDESIVNSSLASGKRKKNKRHDFEINYTPLKKKMRSCDASSIFVTNECDENQVGVGSSAISCSNSPRTSAEGHGNTCHMKCKVIDTIALTGKQSAGECNVTAFADSDNDMQRQTGSEQNYENFHCDPVYDSHILKKYGHRKPTTIERKQIKTGETSKESGWIPNNIQYSENRFKHPLMVSRRHKKTKEKKTEENADKVCPISKEHVEKQSCVTMALHNSHSPIPEKFGGKLENVIERAFEMSKSANVCLNSEEVNIEKQLNAEEQNSNWAVDIEPCVKSKIDEIMRSLKKSKKKNKCSETVSKTMIEPENPTSIKNDNEKTENEHAPSVEQDSEKNVSQKDGGSQELDGILNYHKMIIENISESTTIESTPGSGNEELSGKSDQFRTNNCHKKKRKRRRSRKKVIVNAEVDDKCNLPTNNVTLQKTIETFEDDVESKLNEVRRHIRFTENLDGSELSCNKSLDPEDYKCSTESSNICEQQSRNQNSLRETQIDNGLCDLLKIIQQASTSVVAVNCTPLLVNGVTNSSSTAQIPIEEGTPKQVKDYSQYPSLKTFPAIGAHIAFKVLELTECYCPEVSDYKEGKVVGIDSSTDQVEIELFSEEIKPIFEGKFENIYPGDLDQEPEVIKTVKKLWTELLEAKLLSGITSI